MYLSMIWEPYQSVWNDLLDYCLNGMRVWRSVVLIICFHTIKWHRPNHCLRQFGRDQSISLLPQQDYFLYCIDLRGQINNNWSCRHSHYINVWNDPYIHIANSSSLQ